MIEYQYIYRTDFLSFTKFSFHILHSGETIDESSWYVSVICHMVEFMWMTPEPDVLRRMIFNLPPGCLKTHILSVSLPAWILGRDPRQRVLIVAETTKEALEIQTRCQELMESFPYKAIFPRTRIKKAGVELELTYGGGIRHSGIRHALPYKWSDLLIIDNPESPHTAGRHCAALREFDKLFRCPDKGVGILATRRLCENDMSGFLYNNKWPIFAMSAVGIRKKKWEFPPYDDHVFLEGDLLTERMDWDMIRNRFEELGAEVFVYQYLQAEYVPIPPLYWNCLRYEEDGNVFMMGTPTARSMTELLLALLYEEYEKRLEQEDKILEMNTKDFYCSENNQQSRQEIIAKLYHGLKKESSSHSARVKAQLQLSYILGMKIVQQEQGISIYAYYDEMYPPCCPSLEEWAEDAIVQQRELRRSLMDDI